MFYIFGIVNKSYKETTTINSIKSTNAASVNPEPDLAYLSVPYSCTVV